MKLFISAIAIALAITGPTASALDNYQPGKYEIDPMHSKVGFEIPHLVISTVEGRFTKFEGTIELAEKFEKSKVSVNIDIASIDTSVTKRDDHLKSADFFDAAKYPKMKFETSSISGSPADFKLGGNLTIKNVSKKVVFDSKYLGTVKDGYGNVKAVFQAKTKINRKDFGLTWNQLVEAGPTVGDEVTIDLRIQAAQTKEKK